jgi:hypothetical protein
MAAGFEAARLLWKRRHRRSHATDPLDLPDAAAPYERVAAEVERAIMADCAWLSVRFAR